LEIKPMRLLPALMLPALALPTLALLAGCAAGAAPGPVPDRPGGGACNADAAARFIGQRATAALGAEVLAATGARSLRWGAPGGAMTMDYREDRVNVFHNAALAVERITCG
jgi:hypothetical protein